MDPLCGVGPGNATQSQGNTFRHAVRMTAVHLAPPNGYTITLMDRPCLTRVHTHGFTRKPFAGNNLNPLAAPCLTARETRAVTTRKQVRKSSATGPPVAAPQPRHAARLARPAGGTPDALP